MDASRNAMLEPWKREALQSAIDAADATATRVANYPRALGPVSVAQFLLESDWGRHSPPGANNYFGLKARGAEPFVECQTHEVVNGQTIVVLARFRSFPTMGDCFVAHAELICNRRRVDGSLIYRVAMMKPDDPILFASGLTGVYATDPDYGHKLIAIMQSRGLLSTFGFVGAVMALAGDVR